MAWTETFFCNVCKKEKTEEADDWWLAWEEMVSPTPAVHEPMLKITHWSGFLAHDASVRHLCGRRCAQTLLDRWMHTTTQPEDEAESD